MSPLLFLLFILIELRIAAESFAPGRIVFEKNLVACYLCNFFSFGGWLALLFYLPLFFQACGKQTLRDAMYSEKEYQLTTLDDLTAAQAGIRLLPGVVAGVSGSLFGGLVMKRTGKYYWLTLGAFTFLALGMLPIVLCSGLATNNTYGISVGLVVGGFSNGVGVTTSLISLIANAAQEDQAIATACSYLFRSLGSVVGVSLTAAVVQQSLRKQLQKRLSSSDEAATIVSKVRESLDYLNMLDPATREIVRQCYGHATTAGFGLMMTLAFFAAISSCTYPSAMSRIAANKQMRVHPREETSSLGSGYRRSTATTSQPSLSSSRKMKGTFTEAVALLECETNCSRLPLFDSLI
ncbi:hypothetical protein Q9189_008004 [Teloschistes chrysophthalmus]